MASKMVTDRQKSADLVVAVGQAQGAELAGAAPGVSDVVGELVAQLAAARDAMVAADAAHEQELADDPAARDARDGAAAQLTARVVELRSIVTGLYGDRKARAVFSGATPQDPVVLARFASEVAASLARADLSAPRVAGVTLDQEALASELRALTATLEERLTAVAREVREAQATLQKKNDTIAAYDRVFRGVANVLTGLFELGGHDELADKVRPSVGRGGRTAAQVREDEGAVTDAG